MLGWVDDSAPSSQTQDSRLQDFLFYQENSSGNPGEGELVEARVLVSR